MKKLLAITISMLMILSLSACVELELLTETKSETEAETKSEVISETKSEVISEAISETEAETKPETEVNFKNVFSNALIGLDENDFTKTEFKPYKDGVTGIESYERKDGLMSITTHSYDNTEGLTLEEYVKKVKEQYPGCAEIRGAGETQFAVLSTLIGNGDEGAYIIGLTAPFGDQFITKTYVYPTRAYRFGDSDTYVTVPRILTEEAGTDGYVYWKGFLKGDIDLADIYLQEYDVNGIIYEKEKEGWKSLGFRMVDEDRFNAWAKDGFTLDEMTEYYSAVLGDSIVENYDYKVAGLPGHLIKYRSDYDGEALTGVSIFWVDGDKIREIDLTGPSDKWPCMGEAVANGVYQKTKEAKALPQKISQEDWADAKQFVELSTGIKMAYVEMGNPDGEVVILQHGMTDNSRSWSLAAPFFCEAGYHVYLPDLRGMGKSDAPDGYYTPVTYATDLKAFFDALNIDKAIMVGHSLGSFTVQAFSLMFPEKTEKLVLVSSIPVNGYLNERLLNIYQRCIEPLPENGHLPDAFMDDTWYVSTLKEEELRKEYDVFLAKIKKEAQILSKKAWTNIVLGLSVDNFMSAYSQIDQRIPVLILHGDEDTMTTLEYQEELCGIFRVTENSYRNYDGVGHNIQFEIPRKCATDILGWLATGSLPE